jgi:hypothetical protein
VAGGLRPLSVVLAEALAEADLDVLTFRRVLEVEAALEVFRGADGRFDVDASGGLPGSALFDEMAVLVAELWRVGSLRTRLLEELREGFGWVDVSTVAASTETVFAVGAAAGGLLVQGFRKVFAVPGAWFAAASASGTHLRYRPAPEGVVLVRAPRWTYLPLARLAANGSFWLSDPLPADMADVDVDVLVEGLVSLWCPWDEGSPLADFREAARAAGRL